VCGEVGCRNEERSETECDRGREGGTRKVLFQEESRNDLEQELDSFDYLTQQARNVQHDLDQEIQHIVKAVQGVCTEFCETYCGAKSIKVKEQELNR